MEPGDNTLTVWIEEAKPNPTGTMNRSRRAGEMSPPWERLYEGGIPVQHTADCRKFAIRWTSYVAVAVVNESYALPDDEGDYSGRNLRVYTKSRFLDYVRNATFASDEYPGPYLHFGIACSDQVIEVAAEHPPIVEVVENGDPWLGD